MAIRFEAAMATCNWFLVIDFFMLLSRLFFLFFFFFFFFFFFLVFLCPWFFFFLLLKGRVIRRSFFGHSVWGSRSLFGNFGTYFGRLKCSWGFFPYSACWFCAIVFEITNFFLNWGSSFMFYGQIWRWIISMKYQYQCRTRHSRSLGSNG